MSDKKFITVVIALVVVIAVFRLTAMPVHATPQAEDRLLREERATMEVRKLIYDNYYKKVDEDQLFYGALEGMVDHLGQDNDDPYSRFMPPEQAKQSADEINGNFGGIGISIEEYDGLPQVIVPIANTPADRKGLLPGDLIVAVDGHKLVNTAEMSAIDQAVKLMRVEPGSAVSLTVQRSYQGNVSQVKFNLTREEIHKDSVLLTQILPTGPTGPTGPKIGYTRLLEFSAKCSDSLTQALDSLKSQGAQAMIIDLRHNPGGLLDEAVSIADLWIAPSDKVTDVNGNTVAGVIVSTRRRGPSAKDHLNPAAAGSQPQDSMATPNTRTYPPFLVLLVDRDTASASEVLSGCLKDYRKAILIGRKTYGKGVVQSLFSIPLPAPAAGAAKEQTEPDVAMGTLKLTTASYYTPRGVSIHKIGIDPDVWVTVDPDQTMETYHDEDIAWELQRFRSTHPGAAFAVPAKPDGHARPSLAQALQGDPDIQAAETVLKQLLAGKAEGPVLEQADAPGRLADELRTGLELSGAPTEDDGE